MFCENLVFSACEKKSDEDYPNIFSVCFLFEFHFCHNSCGSSFLFSFSVIIVLDIGDRDMIFL